MLDLEKNYPSCFVETQRTKYVFALHWSLLSAYSSTVRAHFWASLTLLKTTKQSKISNKILGTPPAQHALIGRASTAGFSTHPPQRSHRLSTWLCEEMKFGPKTFNTKTSRSGHFFRELREDHFPSLILPMQLLRDSWPGLAWSSHVNEHLLESPWYHQPSFEFWGLNCSCLVFQSTWSSVVPLLRDNMSRNCCSQFSYTICRTWTWSIFVE